MSAMSFFFPGLLLGIIGPDLFVVNRCSHLPKTIPANYIRDLQEYIIAGRPERPSIPRPSFSNEPTVYFGREND